MPISELRIVSARVQANDLKLSVHAKELFVQLAKLPEQDQEKLIAILMLLSQASDTAETHACEMLQQLIDGTSTKRIALSGLNQIVTYLQTESHRRTDKDEGG